VTVTVCGRWRNITSVKVLVDHGNPFFLAHGGFQIQIEQTKLALTRIGVDVEWVRWWDAGQTGDLIHYFGRPHPAYVQQAAKKQIPIIFSDLLGALGSRGPCLRWIQKRLIRLSRTCLPQEFTIRMGWDSYQLAKKVIALTPWEKRLMEEQFSAPKGKVVVVPNGVEDIFFQNQGDLKREPHLITTMTITERKRSVELVEAATLAGVKIRILGAPYHPKDPYFEKFLTALGNAKNFVEYLGGAVNREIVAQEYKKASGFVLLSAMESQSLSALEAAASGCPLLLSDLPWAKISFGTQASYAPVSSPSTTATYLKRFFKASGHAPLVGKVWRWEEVAEMLQEIYREAITSR